MRAARVVQGTAFADAHASLVGLEVFLLDEAHIVGGHQRRTAALGQCHGGVQVLFVVDPRSALHFQVEAIREHFHPLGQQRVGQRFLAIEQGAADLPFLGRG
ncbi:hypothetical protein D3C76_758520 [compost metagenome]